MKSVFSCIIILIVTINSYAQTYKVFKGDTINRVDSKGRQQGLWRKYYSNDQLFSEGYYKDGKHIGVFKTFHKNGQRQSELRFRGMTEISDAVLYNDSAQLIARGKYIDRNKDSLWTYYYGKTGVVSSEEFYKNGVKEGTWKVMYPSGSIAETEVYKSGKKNGPYKKFFENGKLQFQGNMVNDRLVGKVILYNIDGTIWQQGVYKDGDKHGIWVTYNPDGSVEKSEEFINGLPKNPVKDVPIESPQDPGEK